MIRAERNEIKRTEASQRQEEYDQLSIDEKISRTNSRRGNSAKELLRLKGGNDDVKGKVAKKKRKNKVDKKDSGKSR